MSGLLQTLLIGGLIIGGAVVLINPENRCNYLGLCGQTAEAAPVTSGGVDESASNQNEQGNWDRENAGSKGCCVCEMQGNRVKCQRHSSGTWFNPPAMGGVSNDSDVGLSLAACNSQCGSNATSPTDRERTEVKGVKCPSGYNSINGKCTKITQASSGTGKGSGQNRSTARPAPKPQSTAAGVKKFADNSQARLNATCKGKPKTGMCAKAQYTTAYMGNSNYYLSDYGIPDYSNDTYTNNAYLADTVEDVEYYVERVPKDERNRSPYYVRGGRIY